MNMIEPGNRRNNDACILVPIGDLQSRLSDARFRADPVDESEAFDPLKLLFFAFHHRWMIVAFLFLGLVLGTVYTNLQTPLYRATAQLEISAFSPRVYKDFEVVDSYIAFQNATIKIRSREIAERVAYELDLAHKDDFLAPIPSFSLQNLIDRITGHKPADAIKDWSPKRREAAAIGIVRGGLSINTMKESSVLSISFEHEKPEYAAAVANQIAESYIDYTTDKTSQTSDLAHQFLQERVSETKGKLETAEKALLDYSKSHGLTVTGKDGSLITDNISHLNAALAEAIQERLTIERDRQQVMDGKAASIPAVFESEAVQAKKEKIAELKALYQQKLSLLKPEFPEMLRIRAEIEELKRQVAETVEAITGSVETRYEQAVAKEESLRRELQELEGAQRDYLDKNIQYTILKRDVDSYRAQYQHLVDELNEVGVGRELNYMHASVVDTATKPGAPFTPDLRKNLAIFLAAFAAMAAGLIYLIELLKNNFALPEQVESELNLPVLGIVPADDEDRILEAFDNSKSHLSEAYRSLRTSLQYTGTERDVKTVLVTSSEPGEGKSTSVYKLAQDFGALGRKVLVIDADLRNPSLHRMYSVPEGLGLSNMLSNVVQPGDVVEVFHRTGQKNVTFMSAGNIPPNPVDLLDSPRMATLLRCCGQFFDLILIDSPPVLGLADAPILGRQVDATVMVVSSEHVSRKSARSALSRLKAVGANVVGTALTKVSLERFDYAYAYRYLSYSYDGAGLAGTRTPHHMNWLGTEMRILRKYSTAASNFARKLSAAFGSGHRAARIVSVPTSVVMPS